MKISVIIPVYNSGKYLEKCIKSILEQSYSNWEIIAVNDGSTDNSLVILEKFSSIDSRIVIINQSNQGPGVARNVGIKAATGEYVVFIDADDYIDSEYFNLLVEKAKDNDAVFIDILQVDTQGKVLSKELMSRYKSLDKDTFIKSQMTGKIPWGGVRKAIRRSIIVENSIFYTNLKIGEEALFSLKVLLYSKNIGFIEEKPVYYYVNHEGSQSKIRVDDPWGEVVCVIKTFLTENDLLSKYGDAVNSFNATSTIISIDRIQNNYKEKYQRNRMLQERLDKYSKEYLRDYGLNLKCMSRKAKMMLPFLRLKWICPIVLASRLKGWMI